MDILRAAHAELVVRDLAISRAFYVDVLGFVATEETRHQLFLRGVEERVHHSLILTQGEQPALRHLSFRVASEEDLERLEAVYRDRECHPLRLEAGREMAQGASVLVQDPFGFPVEFFAEMEQVESLHQQYHRHQGGAVRRIDHFNLFTPQFAEAFDFWTGDLGFRLTEYVETDGEPRQKTAAWLARKPSVHDVALMQGLGPRLHHIGFWMEDIHSIIRVCDILGAAGQHAYIERGPGRHGISNAFFLYLRDPDGHRIELYTSDYQTLDPDQQPIRWSAADPRRQTLWGHTTPKSWWQEASLVGDLESGLTRALSEGSKLVHELEKFVK